MTYLTPLLIPAIFFLFIMASWRLKRAAQPLRLEMAEKGEKLLGEKGLSEAAKNQIRMMLSSAFGFRVMLLVSIIATPFIAILVFVRPTLLANADKKLAISDPIAKAEFNELGRLHFRITLANNPILMILVCLELAVVMPFIAVGQMLVRGKPLPDTSVESAVMILLQEPKRRLHNGWLKAA
ncbi:MAG: hypothetical protein ACREC1_07120 [Methylovirgula sp.]